MEQIKRSRSDNLDNSDNKKKIRITSTPLSNETKTYFEDLSNDVIYDIFEFVDYFHAYQAFYNLNIRFNHLLTNSSLPIKVNLSSISKSRFEYFNKDIILSNKDRIRSLYISNLFIYDHISSPITILLEFVQLKSLFLDNIESKYLDNLLEKLLSLPYLSSLSIISLDKVHYKNSICHQIFRLPALKYCKLSMEMYSENNDPLSFAIDEYSPIEHLIINTNEPLYEIDNLLSYVPQLRCLSLHPGHKYWIRHTKMYLNLYVLNHLTNVNFILDDIKFDQFEELVKNIFPTTVRVLKISISTYSNQEYLDANRWRQLILSHMPDLRVFDIRHDLLASNNFNQLEYEALGNQFTSPFWIERQWFFQHKYYYKSKYLDRATFYSTNPYRRKDYMIYKQINENPCLTDDETNVKSVEHVRIQNEKRMIHCQNYFSNANELTFENGFSTNRNSIPTSLSRIISLKQLTKLAVKCHHFAFIRVIELLSHSPNIQTLILESMPLNRNNSMSIQQSQSFRLVSTTNIIKNIIFKDICTLDKLQFLVALCPRLEHLTLNIYIKDMGSLMRFLSDKTNQNTNHIFLLCFSGANKKWLQTLEALIKSETLFDDYMLKLVDSKLYLWC